MPLSFRILVEARTFHQRRATKQNPFTPQAVTGGSSEQDVEFSLYNHAAIWVVVKIMVPFWVLSIIRHLIFGQLPIWEFPKIGDPNIVP